MKKTICLNMIVKNESRVIKRCFDSVKNLIDTWVIVDTGSTDGTQELIKQLLKDKPGELYEKPWKNFGYNRQEALELARGKADYVLIIDADDELIFEPGFIMPELLYDAYCIKQKEALENVFREHDIYLLVKNDGDFEWKGCLHEHLNMKKQKSTAFIPYIKNQYNGDGNRSRDENKIKQDIALLQDAIARNDEVPRALFYLGRTYWSIKAYASAIKCFEKRASLLGDPLEVYHSLLYIGISQQKLNYDPDIFIKSLCRAHLYRPSRAESIYEITRYYTESKNYFLGYITAKTTLEIPPTTDGLFVESWIHEWGALLYFVICSCHIGKFQEAYEALKHLLSKPELPNNIRTSFQLEKYYRELTQILN
jgi:glycosyltransferase involved in cell wall biosynthesis